MWKWNILHVTSVGQRKNLSPRQDSNLRPPKHRAGALSTWAPENSWRARPYTWFIFTVLAPSAITTNKDHAVSWDTLNLWSCPIKHNGHKKQNSRQPETRIIYERRHINIFQKVQRMVLTDGNFSSLFTNHLEVHSRRYMILRNRRAYSFSNITTGVLVDRHCRCLTKIMRLESVFGQIQNRKPSEHFCLLNKL